ncbi:MAG TPA: M48 family metallopeptidase [Longimicrobiales bacterium]
MLVSSRRLRGFAIPALVAGATTLAAGCGISQREEVELGRQYAAEINRELPIVDDPATNRYINLLGDRIARQGGRGLDYTFYIVNTEAVNAFAVPGGYIYVNRGLIEETDNLSELAGVIAHEVGHVEERHAVEQIERMQRANLGLSMAYILLGRAPGTLEQVGIQVAGAAIFAGFSRAAENEADAVAVSLLVQAGINPNGLVTFFEKLLQERERRPSTIEQWFSTHPLTEDRIENTRAVIRRIPEGQMRDLIVNTRQYEEFKARLRQYRPPPQ